MSYNDDLPLSDFATSPTLARSSSTRTMTGQHNNRLIASSTNLLASKIIHMLVQNPYVQQRQLSSNKGKYQQAPSPAGENSESTMNFNSKAQDSATATDVRAAMPAMNLSRSEDEEEGSFPFMRLPVELRQQIFAHMFRQNDGFKIRVETAILRVSKQVHNDLIEVFEKEITAYMTVSVLRHRDKEHTIEDLDQDICEYASLRCLPKQEAQCSSAEEIREKVLQRFSRIRNIRLNIRITDCRRCLSRPASAPEESHLPALTLADLVQQLKGARRLELTGWDGRLPGPDWDIGLLDDLDLGHRDFAILLPPEALPKHAVIEIKDFTGWSKEFTESLQRLYNEREKGARTNARI